jgi:uncharacterized protein
MEPGNALNWFEIPVMDFDRAKKFYETLFSYQMPESMMGPNRMGFFLYDFQAGKVGGAIIYNPAFYTPSDKGALIYLNCQPDLQPVLDKVEGAGGAIVIKKTIITAELGYTAIITDTEGNRIALHSMG